MDTNEIAIKLIDAINEYIAESSKVDYKFSLEEQLKIEKAIAILNNQLNILVEYELKRNK